jgi:uncharacterized protein (TIGR02001 family)
MRNSILGLSAFALVAIATPALAEDDDLGLTITGGASVVSDYRFRGFSQSAEDFAVQGSVTVTHKSGFYGGFWGSSNTFGAGQGTEIDVIGGFSHEIVPGLTGDIGVTYYLYPNKLHTLVANELVEPYAALSGTVGPVWAKVGFAWAPKQDYFFDGEQRNDNTYLWGDASVGVPNTPIKVNGHLGWTSNHYLRGTLNDFSEDETGDSRASVIDYSIGASVGWKALTFGISYVGTDVPSRYPARESELGVFAADSTVVFSIGAAF